ncbi:DNA repair protein RadA [Candidatus Marinamargulisbacteria bacterium SCGC AG-439-L15]|nr:DNA repair protein RadA [Candidatus Marinamargulisbacteria bacterium SCGC AG-439-L15]
MSKVETCYSCENCGALYPRWQGQCSTCKDWNTLKEDRIEKQSKAMRGFEKKQAVSLVDIQVTADEILATDSLELDRVLGAGFVRGGAYLMGGEPGIGKSTLSLQVGQKMAKKGRSVLYVSAEESEKQVFLRSQRIGKNTSHLFVLSETRLPVILQVIRDQKPDLVILDSIQAVLDPQLNSSYGTSSQVRHCASEFIALVKDLGCVGILIGHITKDGALAGPKLLEHLVDVILYFEGDRHLQYRLLRCFKNRFSAAHEVGFFSMEESGLQELDATANLFVDDTTLATPGSVVSAVLEGSRVLLIEIQALVVGSGYGMAKRTVLGVDSHRATLMIATMEKLLGLKLYTKDIFLNIIGGLKVKEPAIDLSIIVAILSSYSEKPLQKRTGILGEVGLTGDIRAVPHVEKRLKELSNLGFEFCLLPAKNKAQFPSNLSIKPLFIENVQDVLPILGMQ